MDSILVTGGSGLVGSHLRELLPDASYISSSDFDLTKESDVESLFGNKWDRVIHLAARVGGLLDNINFPAEFIEENLLMNTLLLKYARLNKVSRVTAVLSTCIYPDVYDSYPLTEEDLHKGEPQSTNFAYAIAKRSLAVQIDAYNRQYGTRYNYLIPCNLYGPHDRFDVDKSHYLTALLGKVVLAQNEGRKSIPLLGTGKPLRQFMYAGDLARVIAECIEKDITDSFNVATDQNLSIREIGQRALDALGFDDLTLAFDEDSPDGQFRKDVSNARMRSLLPEFEFTPLEVGIPLVYEQYKKSLTK